MDKSWTEKHELFFSNLLLLGLDKNEMERKYGIPINKDMFLVPNKKAFEVITHFLFTSLDAVTSENFSIIWPLFEKKQDQEFRKTCYNHFMKMAKDESCNVRFPNIFQTIFLSPGGERFYELYIAFTSYVLFKHVVKYNVVRPLLRPKVKAHNTKVIKETLQLATISSTREFIQVQKSNLYYEQKWQDKAEELLKYFRKTKQKVLEHEKSIEDFFSSLSVSGSSQEEVPLQGQQKFQILNEKCNNEVEELLCKCRTIERYFSKDAVFWDTVKTELDCEGIEKVVIDGQTFPKDMPNILSANFRRNLQARGIHSVFKDGKLSVKSMLGLLCASLEYYMQCFDEARLESLKGMEQVMKDIKKQFESILCASMSLSDKMLVEMLPNITESTRQLSSRLTANQDTYCFAENIPKRHFSAGQLPDLESKMRLTPPTDQELLEYKKEQLGQSKSSRIFNGLQCPEDRNKILNQKDINAVHQFMPDSKLWPLSVHSNSSKEHDDDKTESNDVVMPSEPERDENVRTCIEEFEKFVSVSKNCDTEKFLHKDFSSMNALLGWDDKFERVRSHYAKQIALKVESFSHGEEILKDKSFSPDDMDKRMFNNQDKLTRTPAAASRKVLQPLEDSYLRNIANDVEANSSRVNFFVGSDSLLDNEEQLCNVTMPYMPNF